jgi:hypothetical protein
MAAKVALPPGCTGLDMQDGTRYNPDRHGRVEVSDLHADAIRHGWYGSSGVMVAVEPHAFGTKTGRMCVECRPTRRWNAWTTTCPRCGASTLIEEPTP